MNNSFTYEASKPERKEMPRRKQINRSTSLWNVQAVSRNEPAGRRPSKIPLLAHRNIRVGRSLADLSQVDRAVEPTMQPVPFDHLDLDRSMDERIYENCREAFDNRQPAYTSNLEERVARLMAQLDDDVDDDEHAKTNVVESADCVDAAPPRTEASLYEVREIDVKQSKESSSKLLEPDRYTATVIRIEESLESLEEDGNPRKKTEKIDTSKLEPKNIINPVKGSRIRLDSEKIDRQEIIEESKKKKETSTIKELRKNWEKQANGSAIKEDSRLTEKKVDYVVVPASNAEMLKSTCQRNNETRQETKSKQSVGKRTKEIEHLVNFFNCKNAEASKEVKDPWIKARSPADPLKKNVEVKSMQDYNGYASDGNCSEDSGHMSNENEVEWKEGVVQSESRDFGKERFFEQNDIRQIGVFDDDATIVNRLETEKKPTAVVRGSVSTSSGASSIDSCKGETQKVQEIVGKEQWKGCGC